MVMVMETQASLPDELPAVPESKTREEELTECLSDVYGMLEPRDGARGYKDANDLARGRIVAFLVRDVSRAR